MINKIKTRAEAWAGHPMPKAPSAAIAEKIEEYPLESFDEIIAYKGEAIHDRRVWYGQVALGAIHQIITRLEGLK